MSKQLNQLYEFGEFRLDVAERILWHDEKPVTLTPKAFETLLVLVRRGSHLVEKDELMKEVWGDTVVEEANLARNIWTIRKALGDDEGEHRYIETVPKIGYRFIAPVKELPNDAIDVVVQRKVRAHIVTEEEDSSDSSPSATVAKQSAHLDSEILAPNASLQRVLPPGAVASWWSRRNAGLLMQYVAAIVISVALAVLMTSLYLLRAKPKAGGSTNSTLRFEFTRLTNASGEEAYPGLSPDGKSLVYTSYQGGKAAIYLLRIGGNKPIKLTSDSSADNKQPTFSPDGSSIAFGSGDSGGIFVMGATGENVRRLTEFGANPSWSPDQKQIVFTTDDTWNPTARRINPSELWLVNVETSEKHRLPTPGDAVQPSWSPQGDRIAFWSQNAGGSDNIFTMPAAGGKPVAVTNDESVNWNPVWSPDGGYLYFASDRGGAMNLWRVPIDEKSGNVLGSAEPLTTPASHIEHLCFSRDGRHLAYVNDAVTQNVEEVQFDPQKEAVVGEPRWVTRGIINIASPDLTPDGEWLAYGTLGEKQEDLFVIEVDGTGLRQLTNDVSKDRTPRWSPDGKRIAFESDRSGNFEVWIMNADGSQLRQLTSTVGPGAGGPIWSPDGTRLAYTARGGGGTFIAEMREAAGRLTTNVFSVPGSSEADFRANSWSPDGRKLAGFSYGRHSNSPVKDAAHMLCTYSFDTQKFQQWEIAGVRPVWLNDSRRLMFISGDTIYLLDTDSKRIHKLQDAGPLDYLALSRDDHKILLTIGNYEADIWLMTLQP